MEELKPKVPEVGTTDKDETDTDDDAQPGDANINNEGNGNNNGKPGNGHGNGNNGNNGNGNKPTTTPDPVEPEPVDPDPDVPETPDTPEPGNNGNGNGNNGNGNSAGNNGQGNGNNASNGDGNGSINKTSTVVKNFVVDYNTETFEPLMEHEVNGLDYKYVYGNDRLSVDISPINNSMSIVENGDHIRLYYHMDYLGTADYLTSPVSGRVEAWTHYNEWGLIVHNAVLKCGQRELDLVKRYATHDFDSVMEMYYAKARFYDAHDRRFTAVDPILDPSGYDLREYVENPVQLVQYLYVANDPILLIDLLGLNPTNAFLNIDWSKVSKITGNADNAMGQEQYVGLSSVWKQLQEYYPNAEIRSNNGYLSYYVSNGGNYLQLQKQPNANIFTVSMMKDGKLQTVSLTGKSNSFVSKNLLEGYFRKVWCEDYYLDDVPITDTRYILATLRIADALAEVQELDIRETERAGLREARNFIITGQGKHYNNYYVAIEMQNSKRLKENEIGMRNMLIGGSLLLSGWSFAAGVSGAAYATELGFASFVVSETVSAANNDLEGISLGIVGLIPNDLLQSAILAYSTVSFGEGLEDKVVAPENDYIDLYVMSAGRYYRMTFEVTPDGRLVDFIPNICTDYKLGYEYESHKGQVPPDLKSKYEITPGGRIDYKEWSYGS